MFGATANESADSGGGGTQRAVPDGRGIAGLGWRRLRCSSRSLIPHIPAPRARSHPPAGDAGAVLTPTTPQIPFSLRCRGIWRRSFDDLIFQVGRIFTPSTGVLWLLTGETPTENNRNPSEISARACCCLLAFQQGAYFTFRQYLL